MASGNTLCVFRALDSEPPASNYATVDARNSHLVLDFDAGTEESICFTGVLPTHYAGGGLTVEIYWSATSATTGDVVWGVSVERLHSGGTDIDADSFAAEQNAAAVTANGTSGILSKSTATCSSGANMDSLAAGEPFRLKLARKIGDAGDTMTGDAEVLAVHIKET